MSREKRTATWVVLVRRGQLWVICDPSLWWEPNTKRNAEHSAKYMKKLWPKCEYRIARFGEIA